MRTNGYIVHAKLTSKTFKIMRQDIFTLDYSNETKISEYF